MAATPMSSPSPSKRVVTRRSPSPDKRGYHSQPIPLDKRGGLREFSVVYTDRATNHMSTTFQATMKELHEILVTSYHAHRAVLIPGSGTFAMESVARQLLPALSGARKVMVLRNGYFSYRWTDIFAQTGLAPDHIVLNAQPTGAGSVAQPVYDPHPLEKVLQEIETHKPAVVFAPHIETSTGIRLSEDYISAVTAAVHANGGHVVLDGIAAGFSWINMEKLGVDFYISAPQKTWSSPACVGVVLMGERGYQRVQETQSNSMALNLRKWDGVMQTYLDGTHSYYTTMPTDAIMLFRNNARETVQYGLPKAERGFDELGERVARLLERHGLTLVASPGHRASGVVVAYTTDKAVVQKFIAAGLQVAAGVPFQLGEDKAVWEQGTTFRFGLFGLNKVMDVDATVGQLDQALSQIFAEPRSAL